MASVVSGCVEGVFEQIRRVWHPFLVEEGFPTTVPAGGHGGRVCSCLCHWPLVVPWVPEDSRGEKELARTPPGRHPRPPLFAPGR